MKRRTAVGIAAAGAALAAGAGTAWWTTIGRTPATPAGNGEAFWPLRFERPQGGELAAMALRGRPLLLNFWATWCPPCVEELPLLDRFEHEHRAQGWQVLGLAIDRAEPVRSFLAKHPLGFGVALGGAQGFELIRQLGNSAGGLPFSVAFDAGGRLTQSKLGPLTEADLAAWVGRAG